MSEQTLPKLLADLREADDERLRLPRDGQAYQQAARRVDHIARAVWAAAAEGLGDDGEVGARGAQDL
jgi:hypothetical protein